jgi:hypothetical protein
MITTLKLVVSYDVLGLEFFFIKFVLVMHFLKHVNMQQQMTKFTKYIKVAQGDLQKCINLAKKIKKG